ncbi:helix-turn-helix domain-containing protein [Phaeobacter sp. QD34_3]|uniref:helix-turn-helix domain-containing protein n=1 Tax=unclassified Phaeobacter TaxID=2621772 RepID=UPI00237F902B|nr:MULTISPECIES: helix-turn-helix domain-containing protein [unclassified Phaeobacter]MDE4133730.1 helix-turn-helix domain-containing protein [Phaeobacter sp. QD34_3]MDE4137337.1 helix-turn-helix domain-containing protein [Phaeobacter sp. QD34_24]
MNNRERDDYIAQEYKGGMSIGEIARSYGISERRVSQILREKEISLRPRSSKPKGPLSAAHARVGLHLYNYRFARCMELDFAARDLGWSRIKLRKVEKGVRDLELLDLLDIATFTRTPLPEILLT